MGTCTHNIFDTAWNFKNVLTDKIKAEMQTCSFARWSFEIFLVSTVGWVISDSEKKRSYTFIYIDITYMQHSVMVFSQVVSSTASTAEQFPFVL